MSGTRPESRLSRCTGERRSRAWQRCSTERATLRSTGARGRWAAPRPPLGARTPPPLLVDRTCTSRGERDLLAGLRAYTSPTSTRHRSGVMTDVRRLGHSNASVTTRHGTTPGPSMAVTPMWPMPTTTGSAGTRATEWQATGTRRPERLTMTPQNPLDLRIPGFRQGAPAGLENRRPGNTTVGANGRWRGRARRGPLACGTAALNNWRATCDV